MNGGQSSGDEAHRPFPYPDAPRSDTVERLSRPQDPRPVPTPRRPGLGGDPDLGRGGEPDHLRLPRIDPRARDDPGTPEGPLGLREIHPRRAAKGGDISTPTITGLQNQSVLYTTDSLEGPGRILLDPNTLSADGTVALAGTAVSEDGRLLAYGIAAAGSDWNEWKVRDVETGQDYPDHLKWIKFSGAEWTPDGKGFFYGRFPEPKSGNGKDLKSAQLRSEGLLPPDGDRSGRRIGWSGRIRSTRTGEPSPTSPTMANT